MITSTIGFCTKYFCLVISRKCNINTFAITVDLRTINNDSYFNKFGASYDEKTKKYHSVGEIHNYH